MALEPQPHEEQDIKIQLGPEDKHAGPVLAPAAAQSSVPVASQPAAGQTNFVTEILRTSNHPAVCIMHVIFKFSAIIWYVLVRVKAVYNKKW